MTTKQKKSSTNPPSLRTRAEKKLQRKTAPSTTSEKNAPEELKRIVHELEVHQIELEMQNEELIQARAEVDRLLDRYTELYEFAPVGYFTLTSQGKIRLLNLTGAKLLQKDRERLVGRHFSKFVTITDRPVFANFLRKVFENHAHQSCEIGLSLNSEDPDSSDLQVKIEGDLAADDRECRAVILDITERKSAQAGLEVAMNAAQTANEAKSRFLAAMSHDLRTPLNAIIGFSELTLLEPQGETLQPLQREYLNQIADAGHHLLHLVKDILDVTMIETGHIRLEKKNFFLSPTLNSLAKTYELLASKKKLRFVSDITTTKEISADKHKLIEVFNNLINNAIKFTSAGGTLTLQAYDEQHHITVVVGDTGIGIGQKDLERIFLPMQQVRSHAQYQYVEGHGLGLAICQQLVELHGGHIFVKSTEGVGSCFYVHLPMLGASTGEGCSV